MAAVEVAEQQLLSAAEAKYLLAGMVSTWLFGGVFMSTVGSIFTSTGLGGLPHSYSGVMWKPA